MSSEEKIFVKWVVILIAAIVAAVIAAILVFVYLPSDKPQTSNEQSIALPKTMNFTSAQLDSARASGDTVSVKVHAVIQPSTAKNREVDFALKWADNAPSSYTENVNDYMVVKQDYDGSLSATVTCKKAFTAYNIILTVTTREGAFTDSCVCSFNGVATDMSIVVGQMISGTFTPISPTSTRQRGEYYELSQKKDYYFKVELINAFDHVTSSRVSWDVNVNGKLYFGDAVSDGYGALYYSNIQLKNLEDMYKAGRFAKVSKVSETELKVSAIETVEYSSASSENVDGYMHYTDSCIFDEYDFGVGGEIGVHEKNDANVNAMPSCYFEIVFTEAVSGMSDSVRFWITF